MTDNDTFSIVLIQTITKYSKDTEKIRIFDNLMIIEVFDERLYISPSRGEDIFYAPTFWCSQNTTLTFVSYQERLSDTIIQFNDFDTCYS